MRTTVVPLSLAYDHPSGIFTSCLLEPGDTGCSNLFIPTYETHKKNVGRAPGKISLDRGYDERGVREHLPEGQDDYDILVLSRGATNMGSIPQRCLNLIKKIILSVLLKNRWKGLARGLAKMERQGLKAHPVLNVN